MNDIKILSNKGNILFLSLRKISDINRKTSIFCENGLIMSNADSGGLKSWFSRGNHHGFLTPWLVLVAKFLTPWPKSSDTVTWPYMGKTANTKVFTKVLRFTKYLSKSSFERFYSQSFNPTKEERKPKKRKMLHLVGKGSEGESLALGLSPERIANFFTFRRMLYD